MVIAGESRSGSQEINEASWTKVERVCDPKLIETFHHHGLSRKDAAVIALVQERGADAIVDEG